MTVGVRVLKRLLCDDDGAVTVDWVALTAGTLLLGTVIVWAVYKEGVAPIVLETSSAMSTQSDILEEVSMDVSIEPPAELFSIK